MCVCVCVCVCEHWKTCLVIYQIISLDAEQDRMNRLPNETQTHLSMLTSLACSTEISRRMYVCMNTYKYKYFPLSNFLT